MSEGRIPVAPADCLLWPTLLFWSVYSLVWPRLLHQTLSNQRGDGCAMFWTVPPIRSKLLAVNEYSDTAKGIQNAISARKLVTGKQRAISPKTTHELTHTYIGWRARELYRNNPTVPLHTARAFASPIRTRTGLVSVWLISALLTQVYG